jgi:hypothetical protein
VRNWQSGHVGESGAFSGLIGAGQKMTCRETGKTMDKCCCEMKDGKFYCKLTKKTYDQCCCDMK